MFRWLKAGNIDLSNKQHKTHLRKVEDPESHALLKQDDIQSERRLADPLRATNVASSMQTLSMKKVQMDKWWGSHELSNRWIEDWENKY